MEERLEICPICKLKAAKTSLFTNCDLISCECRDCGRYVMPRPQFHYYQSATYEDRKQIRMRSAIMLERNLKGLNYDVRIKIGEHESFCYESTGEEISADYPTIFRDKLERGFINVIKALKWTPTVSFSLSDIQHNYKSLLFIDDAYEAENVILGYMVEEGWLKEKGNGDAGRKYRVTAKGMDLFDNKNHGEKSNRVFLAMWFGVNGSRAYRDMVSKAVETAGYHLQVVDVEDYNGFIMDKVVNLINDSAFVIADISAAPERVTDKSVADGVRGGVYWEAGYAAGQKKQVILTCRDDEESKRRIHFDLQQYNQIRWDVVDGVVKTGERDFTDVLTQRILATMGKGRKA